MSAEAAKRVREAMKSKAARMAAGDPHAKVDASSWTPPKALDADVQTGERPVSRRQYQRGGKVDGEKTVQRADRAVRVGNRQHHANGGDVWDNRDMRKANEAREGVKHVGGFANGGNAGDTVPTSRMAFTGGESRLSKAAGLKTGGRAKKAIGGDLSMLSPVLMLANGLRGKKDDDGPPKKAGGSVNTGTRPTGGRIARKSGGKASKMNVNIIIADKGAQAAPPDAGMPPPMPPKAIPVPPTQPQGMPMAGGPPPALPGGMPPPMAMARKRGGKVEAGAGSGLGRLEKVDDYGKRA